MKQAANGIAGAMKKTVTIVNKSTVPIGTGNIVARIVSENLREEIPFYVVSNPEFLREEALSTTLCTRIGWSLAPITPPLPVPWRTSTGRWRPPS